jgi:hypothetical protein
METVLPLPATFSTATPISAHPGSRGIPRDAGAQAARPTRFSIGNTVTTNVKTRKGKPLALLALTVGMAAWGCARDSKSADTSPPAALDTGVACTSDDLDCNGLDDDCDGVTDEPGEALLRGWMDEDGDGHGGGEARLRCEALTADRWTGDDCDDSDPAIHPGAWDVVGDGIDADCDGADRQCAGGGTRVAHEGSLDLATVDPAALCSTGDWVQGGVELEGTDTTDLSALSCLCEIEDGLTLHGADELASLDGLSPGLVLGRSLDLRQLPSLRSTAALGAVQWRAPLRTPARFIFQDLPELAVIEGVEGISELDDLSLAGTLSLDLGALSGLTAVHETLDIRDTTLPSLEGLEQLALVGELRIDGATGLETLAPLGGVRRVRFLTLQQLDLDDLSDFSGLERIDRRLTINRVGGLGSLAGLDSLLVLGGLELVGNPDLAALHGLLPAVDGLAGELTVRGNPQLIGLEGLEGLDWIGGSVVLGGAEAPTHLESLAGLARLRIIGGSLAIAHAPALHSLSGLGALEEVGGDLWATTIYDPAPGPFAFSGLDALQTVHGTLGLVDHATASSLAGLETVGEVGGLELEQNPALLSLDGLDSLRTVGDLRIVDNANLADIDLLYGIVELTGSICVQLPAMADEPAAWLASTGRVNGC